MSTRSSLPIVVAVAAVLGPVASALPARGDDPKDSIVPIVPRRAALAGRAFDAAALTEAIGREGEVRIAGGERETLVLRPLWSLWKPGGREPLASGRGDAVTLAAGAHSIATASGRSLPAVAVNIRRYFDLAGNSTRLGPKAPAGGAASSAADQVEVLSVETVDAGSARVDRGEGPGPATPELDFPRQEGALALALEWVATDAAGARELRSRMLVVYLRTIGETEKN